MEGLYPEKEYTWGRVEGIIVSGVRVYLEKG